MRSSPSRPVRRCASPGCARPAACRPARVGVVEGDEIDVQGSFSIPLTELRTAYEGTLPDLFG